MTNFIEGDVDIAECIMGEFKYQHSRTQNFNELLRRVFKWLGHDVRVWATNAHICRAVPVDTDPNTEQMMKYITNVAFVAYFDAGCNSDEALRNLINAKFLPIDDVRLSS